MLAVVGVEVHLFDFAHQRIARICAGALVVERLLDHRVEPLEEVLLVRDVVADRALDADAVEEAADLLDEVLELFALGLSCHAESICDFEVALEGAYPLRSTTLACPQGDHGSPATPQI